METQEYYLTRMEIRPTSHSCPECGEMVGIEATLDTGEIVLDIAGNKHRMLNMIHVCGAVFYWRPPRENAMPEFVRRRMKR